MEGQQNDVSALQSCQSCPPFLPPLPLKLPPDSLELLLYGHSTEVIHSVVLRWHWQQQHHQQKTKSIAFGLSIIFSSQSPIFFLGCGEHLSSAVHVLPSSYAQQRQSCMLCCWRWCSPIGFSRSAPQTPTAASKLPLHYQTIYLEGHIIIFTHSLPLFFYIITH